MGPELHRHSEGGCDVRVDVYVHTDSDAKLDKLIQMVTVLTEKEVQIMANLDDIEAAVAAEATVEQGVIMLLNQLSADLTAAIAGGDPAKLPAILTNIQANTAALSAAVVANTPATPTPPTTTEPPTTEPPAPTP